MLPRMLKLPAGIELPESRIRHFWQEAQEANFLPPVAGRRIQIMMRRSPVAKTPLRRKCLFASVRMVSAKIFSEFLTWWCKAGLVFKELFDLNGSISTRART